MRLDHYPRAAEVKGQVDFVSYKGASVALAVDLVNTRPVGRWPEELPDLDTLAAFLEAHDIAPGGAVTQRDLTEVRAVRDRLAAAVEAHDEQQAAEILNSLLAKTRARPEVIRHGASGWHVHYRSEAGGLASTIGAVAAMGLAAVLADSGLRRVGICADDDCDSYFVDASRNASRRYCCQRCAVRSGVAAHRARARARGGDGS
jgi:predicted RNA-binding Zn ribbon-like protein